jgi:hypothetical protein
MKKLFLFFSSIVLLISACKKSKTDNLIAEEKISRPKPPKTQGTPRILFIGNSHTEYFVSAPVLFDEFCKANKKLMNIDQLVTMGVSIEKVYDDHKIEAEENFAKTDADGNYYDFVVIQESTPVALGEPDKYESNVKMITNKVRKNSPGAAIYIYEGMSPVPFTDPDYQEYYNEMRKNAISTAKSIKNAGVLKVGDAINDAYNGKEDYKYLSDGKDNLRFGENTLHLLNDGGFMQAVLLYATIFDQQPIIPTELTLSTGTGDNDEMEKQKISTAITNPSALEKIAFGNR